jgi:hypothetical protein
MPGIADDTVDTFRNRVETFSATYIEDWAAWLATDTAARPGRLGRTLRKWQACRPNRMRREAGSAVHPAPYLDDLLAAAAPHVDALAGFDIAHPSALDTPAHLRALDRLWHVFEQLSYHGRARQGLAGSVAISKAVMLVTNGRVGPAFDSSVRRALKLGEINDASQWRNALSVVHADIQKFQCAAGIPFSAAKPAAFAAVENGRVYDMALGPR